jgi:hypothetical protein
MSQLTELIDGATSTAAASGPDVAKNHLEQCFLADLRLFEFLLENRDVVGLMLEGGGSATTQHLIENLASHSERQTAAYLTAGIASGVYRSDLDVETTAAFIAGGYDRVARRLLCSENIHNLPELIRQWQRQVVSGVGSPELIRASEVFDPQEFTKPPTPGASASAAPSERKESP